MAPLACRLGLYELQCVHAKFVSEFHKLAPDSVLFQAEVRRLGEEIKVLGYSADSWDILIRHGRTISPNEYNSLAGDREKIMNSFRYLARQLQHTHNAESWLVGWNGPYGNSNDVFDSSSSCSSASASPASSHSARSSASSYSSSSSSRSGRSSYSSSSSSVSSFPKL